MKRALVPVADGTTESEAVVLAEVLRRAGVEVVIAASSLVAVTGGFGLRRSSRKWAPPPDRTTRQNRAARAGLSRSRLG